MICSKCEIKLKKENQRKIVIDTTWWPSKYKTIRFDLCDDCSDEMMGKIDDFLPEEERG